jgi:hypothetical protein
MLAHDFVDMPGRSTEIGDNPHETVMLLRCRWCLKTPMKARADGCPMHELQENGSIVLSEYNPEGVERFGNRLCVTCERPIMSHSLRKGSDYYWCHANQNQWSDGMSETIWDVPANFGKHS